MPNLYEKIKVVAMDCDGVLTDGAYQVSDSGGISKSFYTRDFYAIERILEEGMVVIIITQSKDNVIKNQLLRICNDSPFWEDKVTSLQLMMVTDSNNKFKDLDDFISMNKMSWENVAYIGDAENDFECIESAGFSGCPIDAVPYVREKAMYPSDYYGGKGAVHDFCMHLLSKKIEAEAEIEKESENENS